MFNDEDDMPYKYKVVFERKLSGNLNGLSIKDSLKFPSKEDAKSWIEGIKLIDRGQFFSDFKICRLI